MRTVLKNLVLEVLVLMTRLIASVLKHGIGLLVEPMKVLFNWLSSKNTDLHLWFYDVLHKLESMKNV